MANRFDTERGRDHRNDEFRNRGRSEWDDDHRNGSGHGRAYGRPRLDEDNDQGRVGTQPYYDDRSNEHATGSRSGRYDQDWSDRMPYAEQHPDDWQGRGSAYGRQEQDYGGGWRNQPDNGGPRRFGGLGGGSAGYGANRDHRANRPTNYGGADLHDDFRYGSRNYDQGRFGQGGMTGYTGYGTGEGIPRDSGAYSTDWAQTGQMGGNMTHHDQDYHHWRSQEIGKLDKDYEDWRAERRKKFREDFESWRASRPLNPADEHLANANPLAPENQTSSSNASNSTGMSQSGSSRNK